MAVATNAETPNKQEVPRSKWAPIPDCIHLMKSVFPILARRCRFRLWLDPNVLVTLVASQFASLQPMIKCWF